MEEITSIRQHFMARWNESKYWSLQARRALVGLLSRQQPKRSDSLDSLVNACDLEELVELAISQGVAGPANERLQPYLSPAQQTLLLEDVDKGTRFHLAMLDLIEVIGAEFDRANVKWAVYKGPVLRELSYQGPWRSYVDLDLLVSPKELKGAVRALEKVGAVVGTQDWPGLIKNAKGELALSIYGSPLILLHWHLIWHRGTRERLMLPTDELLERRQQVKLGPITTWSLEPADFIAHVALYATYTPSQRLKALLDIERTAANYPPDWDALVERSNRWKINLPLSASMNCAVNTLGAAVPSQLITTLTDNPLENLVLRILDTWTPTGRLPGKRSLKVGLSRSLRSNVAETGADFLSKSAQVLADLAHTRILNTGALIASHDEPSEVYNFETYNRVINGTDRYGHIGAHEIRRLLIPT
jgi:Uncharacterised nucleotidyltransferase